MQEIPLQALPAQRFNIILNEQDCAIRLFWRFGRCYMDLTVNGEAVAAGAICQANVEIIQRQTRLFTGNLVFVDLLGREVPPQWSGLGDRWRLIFLEQGESVAEAIETAAALLIEEPSDE